MALLVTFGLIGSLTHYHHESLECLVHVGEEHFVQDEDTYCPACTLGSDTKIEADSYQVVLPNADVSDFIFDELYIEKNLAQSKDSRAPPFLA